MRFLGLFVFAQVIFLNSVQVAKAQFPGENSAAGGFAPQESRPNIVLINLDDADRDMLRPESLERFFPSIHELAQNGMTFTNFHVTSPLCGPSRACLLRGQYSHAVDNRVNKNGQRPSRGFTGDLSNFVANGYYDDDIGKWVQDAGYRTIFCGKYLNGKFPRRLPAGWHEFSVSLGADYYLTKRFTNRTDPNGRYEQLPANVYRTDAEAADIVHALQNRPDENQPFFVYWAPFGPHTQGASPAPMIDTRYNDIWPTIKRRRQADYAEVNMSDKGPIHRDLPMISDGYSEWMDTYYRDRMISVKSIDDAVARLMGQLEASGDLENTFIFFTSDNGFSLGEHRLAGKKSAFTRSAHVPLIVVGPDVPAGETATHLLGHIDLAPTILEIADGGTKPFFDGKSFLSVLRDEFTLPDFLWRESLLIENYEALFFDDRRVNSTYSQLRFYDATYTEWADGSRAFFDLANDPLELHNSFKNLPDSVKTEYSNALKNSRQPMELPLVVVERPAPFTPHIVGPPFSLRGLAEDSEGIGRVTLLIQNDLTSEYWNGEQWQANRTVVEARLRNPLGIQTEWSYLFAPPQSSDPELTYTFRPRSYSLDGRFVRKTVPTRFKHDSMPPVTSVDQVILLTDQTRQVTGGTTDNAEVKNVKLIFQNLITKRYFDGESWSSDPTFQMVVPDAEGIWSSNLGLLAPGRYIVRARAYDQAGNFDVTPAIKRFTVE